MGAAVGEVHFAARRQIAPARVEGVRERKNRFARVL
jgi:hypothetical protein